MRLIVVVFCLLIVDVLSYDWTQANNVLIAGIADTSFPGCVALVADKTGVLLKQAFGNYTYGAYPPNNPNTDPPMTTGTQFDMASCTKVTTTNTAVMQFYQRGEIALNQQVSNILGPAFSVNGKQNITILNLLLHNSGFHADPIPFWNTPQFACPQTKQYHPPETLDCSEKIYASLLNQSLLNPIGAKYLYSDLNYITLMYVIGHLADTLGYVTDSDLRDFCKGLNTDGARKQCYFEAYIRKYVFDVVGMSNSGFRIPETAWSNCAPTVNDTVFQHDTYQGQVSDGNAYIMGGIAGHAGLFSNVDDLYALMTKYLFADPNSSFLNSTTVSLFIKEYNHSQSSRALGWNTNDHTVVDQGFTQACGTLSPLTFMHTGYTGTLICVDPTRELIAILLTNRVYPEPTDTNEDKIIRVRRQWTTAIQIAYDKGKLII
jgi:CubicO group peptidase (beta-lactamase class C family)